MDFQLITGVRSRSARGKKLGRPIHRAAQQSFGSGWQSVPVGPPRVPVMRVEVARVGGGSVVRRTQTVCRIMQRRWSVLLQLRIDTTGAWSRDVATTSRGVIPTPGGESCIHQGSITGSRVRS